MRTTLRLSLGLLTATLASACTGGDGGGGGGGGAYRGFVTAGLERDATFGDAFTGSAVFLTTGIDDNGYFEAQDGDCSNDSVDDVSGVGFQDAGDSVVLTTTGGTLTLDPLLPGLYASFSGTDASVWTMGGTVTVSAPGGSDIDAFERTFPLSGAFTLTTPDPEEDVVLDPGADLTIAWTSSGTADPIFVTVEQYDFDADETTFVANCRFDDDGSGLIPASFLAGLSTDAELETSFSISKERLTTISDIPGLGGELVADGLVSYSLTGVVQ